MFIQIRFADSPDTYNQFIEILKMYKRESKPIQDVYAQVKLLLNDAPDLMEDFKYFVPESAVSISRLKYKLPHPGKAAEGGIVVSNVHTRGT